MASPSKPVRSTLILSQSPRDIHLARILDSVGDIAAVHLVLDLGSADYGSLSPATRNGRILRLLDRFCVPEASQVVLAPVVDKGTEEFLDTLLRRQGGSLLSMASLVAQRLRARQTYPRNLAGMTYDKTERVAECLGTTIAHAPAVDYELLHSQSDEDPFSAPIYFRHMSTTAPEATWCSTAADDSLAEDVALELAHSFDGGPWAGVRVSALGISAHRAKRLARLAPGLSIEFVSDLEETSS